VKCCRNLVKFFKIMITLTYESNIQDSLPEWDRATPINLKKRDFHAWNDLDGSKLDESKSHEPII